MTNNLDELRAEAERLGVNVDGRWGAPRLQQEIDNHQPAPYDDEDEAAWCGDPVPDPPIDDEVCADDEPTQEFDVAEIAAYEPDSPAPGRRRAWVDPGGRRKTTTTGSGLDRWYEKSPNWSPA